MTDSNIFKKSLWEFRIPILDQNFEGMIRLAFPQACVPSVGTKAQYYRALDRYAGPIARACLRKTIGSSPERWESDSNHKTKRGRAC